MRSFTVVRSTVTVFGITRDNFVAITAYQCDICTAVKVETGDWGEEQPKDYEYDYDDWCVSAYEHKIRYEKHPMLVGRCIDENSHVCPLCKRELLHVRDFFNLLRDKTEYAALQRTERLLRAL